MTVQQFPHTTPAHVVLADATVLYSRVLRDYLLYAATRRIGERQLRNLTAHGKIIPPGLRLIPQA